MAVVEELIRIEENGAISFGNHKLAEKTKKSVSKSGIRHRFVKIHDIAADGEENA